MDPCLIIVINGITGTAIQRRKLKLFAKFRKKSRHHSLYEKLWKNQKIDSLNGKLWKN